MPHERRHSAGLAARLLGPVTPARGQPVRVYLGLGSNLGQREENLRRAIRLLGCHMHLVRASSLYETAPWGYTDQPDFLNCVLEAETTLTPVELLALGQQVEREVGRQPTFRYGPRLVDVDVLLYGDQVVQEISPDLQIPHPRLAERAFVLAPLAELAPELPHPTLGVTIAALLANVAGKEGVKVWGPPVGVG